MTNHLQNIIPKSWKIAKIKEVMNEFQNGYAFSSKGYVNEGTPIISMAMISLEGRFQFDINKCKKWTKDEEHSLKRYILKEGNLIMAMTDVTPNKDLIGRMAIINQKGKYLLNQRVGHLRLIETIINPSYLSYYGNSEIWLRNCRNMASQGAQANIGTAQISESYIPLPPLPEQQKIAEILSTVDEKIEAIDQSIAETQELKKGLMQQLLTKGIGHTKFKDSPLGEIPESWEVVISSEIFELIHGYQFREYDFTDTGLPVVKIGQINSQGEIDMTNCSYFSEDRAEEFRDKIIFNGDVLMALTGATLGKSCWVSGLKSNVYQNYRVGKFEPRDENILSKRYLYFLIGSPLVLNQIFAKVNSGAQGNIGKADFEKLKITLPSIAEQNRISEILSNVDEKLQIQQDKKTEYQALKKGLMQQLLTGKIRVKVNPN